MITIRKKVFKTSVEKKVVRIQLKLKCLFLLV